MLELTLMYLFAGLVAAMAIDRDIDEGIARKTNSGEISPAARIWILKTITTIAVVFCWLPLAVLIFVELFPKGEN
jgi:hypothetical protein